MLLQHPSANRSTQLQGQTIHYCLVRSRQRKTLSLIIKDLGLEVRAPQRLAETAVEDFLQRRSRWVLQHLAARSERQIAPEIWTEGSQHPLHGHPLTLTLRDTITSSVQHGHTLHLALPSGSSAGAICQAYLDWLWPYAQHHFSQRLDHYAAQMGVRWQRLALSRATTRWGSAKSDGSIRLHWRLVQLAPELLDYVVVHELAHLREMNHSPRFWAIVEQHCPNWRVLRQQLKAHSLQAPQAAS